jgi:hypothetical protein
MRPTPTERARTFAVRIQRASVVHARTILYVAMRMDIDMCIYFVYKYHMCVCTIDALKKRDGCTRAHAVQSRTVNTRTQHMCMHR